MTNEEIKILEEKAEKLMMEKEKEKDRIDRIWSLSHSVIPKPLKQFKISKLSFVYACPKCFNRIGKKRIPYHDYADTTMLNHFSCSKCGYEYIRFSSW
jgi:DNA-directed RNA polymerase subunit M/transcription elongation factor TFIIS